jgi:hypothetical protein
MGVLVMAVVPDHLPNDLKMTSLSPTALRLWLLARCHCAANETDGLIARSALVTPLGAKRKDVAELVKGGVWDPLESGAFFDNAYLEDTSAVAHAQAQREKGAERVRRHRAKNKPPDVTLQEALQDALPRALPRALPDATPEICASDLDPSGSGSPESSGNPECISSYKPPEGTDLVARASKKSAAKVVRKSKRDAWREAQLALVPDAEHARIASEMGVDLALQLAKFKDHDFARPREDAAATFRNWLRSQYAQPTNGKAPGLLDHEARRLEANTRAMQRDWAQEQRAPAPSPLPPGERLELAQGALKALAANIGKAMR